MVEEEEEEKEKEDVVAAAAAMSLAVSAGGHSFCFQAAKGFSISKPNNYKLGPRAALVEARPKVNGSPSPVALQVIGGDRAEDLQAEAKALSRAANASVYSPEFLARKYGSRPVQVMCFLVI